MPSPSDPAGLQDADFETIEAAVNETARGRWFLAEYARRTRAAETERLVAAMSRIERAVEETRQAIPFDVQRFQAVAQELAQRLGDVAHRLGVELRPDDERTDFEPIANGLPHRLREPAHERLDEERRLIEQRLIEPLRDVGLFASGRGVLPPGAREEAVGHLSGRLESMRRFETQTQEAPSIAPSVAPSIAPPTVTLADIEAMPLRDRLRFFG